MIWVLLGILLFGGSGVDLSQPHVRVAVVKEYVATLDPDPSRDAIVERLLAETVDHLEMAKRVDARIRELDAAETLDEGGYSALVTALADEIDARERRMLDLHWELRGKLTREQWAALYERLGAKRP